jgi:transposase
MVVADNAFDDESLRRLLRWLGIEPVIPKRGAKEHGLGARRRFVERTMSCLHKFRRLRTRWDRRSEINQAFHSLAAAIICHRLWAAET